MQYLIRKWNCRNCGLCNATEIALDGSVKCDHCADVMKIQPSRARGGETPDQLSTFIQADALSRQGEWKKEHEPWRVTVALALFLMISFAHLGNAQIPHITIQTPVLSKPIDPDPLPKHLAADSSGNVWFTYSAVFPHQIGFFSVASGAVTTFPILQPDPAGLAAGTTLDDFQGLTIGPDGNAWFVFVYAKGDGSPLNSYVGSLSSSGAVAAFPLPTNDACFNADCSITPGPDGNLWLTEYNSSRIARVTTRGVVTEFATPTPGAFPAGITSGLDSNIWFTEYLGRKIGRITPDGTITEFSIPTPNSTPLGITAGPDGSLWFTEYAANKIGRITLAGTITEFPLPVAGALPSYIVSAPDGNLYFTMFGSGQLGQLPPTGGPFAFAQTDIQPFYIVVSAPARAASTSSSAPAASPSSSFSLFFSGVHGSGYDLRDAVSDCPPITIRGLSGRICDYAPFDSYYIAEGGTGTLSYALTPQSGSLPSGLTIGSVGGGPPHISGSALASVGSSYSFLVTVIDEKGCTESVSFTVTIVDCTPEPVETRPPNPRVVTFR
jgi:streptogramin lyase